MVVMGLLADGVVVASCSLDSLGTADQVEGAWRGGRGARLAHGSVCGAAQTLAGVGMNGTDTTSDQRL